MHVRYSVAHRAANPFPRTYFRSGHYGVRILSPYGSARPLSGAGIGVCALASYRQSPAVTNPPVASEIHQSLDVHRHFPAQIALGNALCNFGAQCVELGLRQVTYRHIRTDFSRLTYRECAGPPYAVYVRQRDPHMFPVGDVDSSNSCHGVSFPLLRPSARVDAR